LAVPATSEPALTAASFTSDASDFATSDLDPAPEPEPDVEGVVDEGVVLEAVDETYVGGDVTPDKPPDVADPPPVDSVAPS